MDKGRVGFKFRGVSYDLSQRDKAQSHTAGCSGLNQVLSVCVCSCLSSSLFVLLLPKIAHFEMNKIRTRRPPSYCTYARPPCTVVLLLLVFSTPTLDITGACRRSCFRDGSHLILYIGMALKYYHTKKKTNWKNKQAAFLLVQHETHHKTHE